MPRFAAIVLVTALVCTGAGRAAAQDGQDYFTEQTRTPLTYRVEGERTSKQRIVLVSLAGATVVAGGLGLYFNLQSRDAADEVRALSGRHTGLVYTDQVDDRRGDANRFGTAATILYGLGGALLVSTVVAYIVTSPPDEIKEYETSSAGRVAAPYVAPIEGGFVFGNVWRY